MDGYDKCPSMGVSSCETWRVQTISCNSKKNEDGLKTFLEA